jgi:hypothetical protein
VQKNSVLKIVFLLAAPAVMLLGPVAWLKFASLVFGGMTITSDTLRIAMSALAWFPAFLSAQLELPEVGLWIATILVMVAAVATTASKRSPRSLLATAGLASIALSGPLVAWYTPALSAIDPSKTLHVTNATGVTGLLMLRHRLGERTPCTYTLISWREPTLLEYSAHCAGRDETRLFDTQSRRTQATSWAANGDHGLSARRMPFGDALELVRAPVSSAEHEFPTRRIMLKGDGLLSPEGRWVALITQHIYGPQDVIIVPTAP